MEKSKFTISLLGFDDRSAETLAHAARATMQIVDPINKDDTQVVVVDIEGPDGATIWDEFRKQWPAMPAVVVCGDDPDFNDASFAEKPFTVETLIDNITEAIILAPSVEDIATDTGEPMPENEELELQPVSDSTVEMATKPELEQATTLEEASDEMEEFSIELTMAEISSSPSVENISSDSSDSSDSSEDIFEKDALDFQLASDSASEVTTEAELEESTPEAPSDETNELSLELTSSESADFPSVEAVSNDTSDVISEIEEVEFTSILDRAGEIENESELKPQSSSDSPDEITAWFASQENTLSEGDAYEMEELSLELNSADSLDYQSVETTPNDASEVIPGNEALYSQSVSDSTTEIVAEPELEETAQAEETIDEMDEPSLESNISETPDSPSAEAPTDTVDEGIAAEEVNEVIETGPDQETDKDTAVIKKEIRPLSEIARVLSSRSSITGELHSRTLDSPNPEDAFFNPDAHIIGLVLKGVEEGKNTGAIAKLACLLDRTIYIDARNKIVSSNLKDIHMRQIAIAPLGKGDSGLDTQLEMIESTSIEELSASDGSIYPMETFIWELALLTSKGRAPVDTPMDKPTYLMQWPNFTRLMQSPNDMKIAAYWLRLPSSLIDLSENLDVPINDVRLMYSAAFLTGLAGLATRKSDNIVRPGKPEKHKNRNLFGSLMNKLKKH